MKLALIEKYRLVNFVLILVGIFLLVKKAINPIIGGMVIGAMVTALYYDASGKINYENKRKG